MAYSTNMYVSAMEVFVSFKKRYTAAKFESDMLQIYAHSGGTVHDAQRGGHWLSNKGMPTLYCACARHTGGYASRYTECIRRSSARCDDRVCVSHYLIMDEGVTRTQAVRNIRQVLRNCGAFMPTIAAQAVMASEVNTYETQYQYP